MKYRSGVETPEDQLEGRLLQNGCVVMYFDARIKTEHARRLQATGWEYSEVYVGSEGTWDEFSRQVSTALRFAEYYGKNLDAFADCLSDIEFPKSGKLALGFERFDVFANKDRETAQIVLDILAGEERRFVLAGRRILFLLRSSDPRLQFEGVGAQPVLWNFEEMWDCRRPSEPE